MDDFETTPLGDLQNVLEQGERNINVAVRVVSHPQETEGGRCSWQVEDLVDESYKCFLVCFNNDIKDFIEVFQKGMLS